eukprot:CAMPEP_0113943226 /NCGR_PEP_ID=MMETSP1339-20121228/21381_1 /TAXON_ID=94617 /ORGANISM="Fibrocapsa japonica" /LENGTH=159 /DNA_ID=CAMNT_0000948043 /DNA_START=270 /DNA_END=749 /DNA_ORIENTATION=+ /assembly_acc=CAM_ASM_000762
MMASNDLSPNPVIKVASSGMSLIKPLFVAEANIQASVLGAIGGVKLEDVTEEVENMKNSNKVLIYTYGLSPFSSEALALLDASGYEYKKVELGLEWFLLGPKESQTRVALSTFCDDGATSLPKIFIGGECIGGFSALASLIEANEFEEKMKQAKVPKLN